MSNILTVFLLLTIVLKVVDLSSLMWLDYVIVILLILNLAMEALKIIRRKGEQ